MKKRLLLIVAASLIGSFVVSGSAVAATVVPLDLDSLVADSDVIVTARVTDVDSNREDDGRVYTTVSFSTTEIFDGEIDKEFTIRHVGGRDGDIATYAPGMPGFRENERVFLFLKQRGDQPVVTGLSQGKFQIAVGPDDRTDFVIPQVDGVHFAVPDDADEPDPKTDAPDAVDTPEPGRIDARSHADLFDRVHLYELFADRVEQVIESQREESE